MPHGRTSVKPCLADLSTRFSRIRFGTSELVCFGATVTQSLEVLADHSAELRDRGEALAALEESVAITRDLAATDPRVLLAPLSAPAQAFDRSLSSRESHRSDRHGPRGY